MRWSKIKNIIILLLVIVNGFLLGQVGLRNWQSRRNERESRERMVAILARNDVTYLPGEVPGALELTGRRVTLETPGETQAAALVGAVAPVSTVGARVSYEGPRGIVVCSASGEMEARFYSEAVSEEELGQLLTALGMEVRETGREVVRNTATVTYVQLWNGVPVPGMTVTATVAAADPQSGYLETLTFRRLAGEEELLPAEDTITASTALTRLLDELNRGEGYVCSQIISMYPGYVSSGTGTVTLTPAWFIETDTWRFTVDGYTGSVTAME